MPRLLVTSGELTGHLREGAEAAVLSAQPTGHTGGRRIRVDRVIVMYRLEHEPAAAGVIPNIDPYRGYEREHVELTEPNGEDAHPHDDATGHVERTHEDFGPRLPKSHSGVGC